jgi:diguanylate cyclase (GGDEF)-like protein
VSILIVADEASTCESLRKLLESRGHADVFCASSGQEALARLGAARPVDTVLLDADLTGLDGIEICRRIKAVPDFRDLPVVMLIAGVVEPTLEAAFVAGACDFVAKPIQPPDLLARVRAALSLKRQKDECKAREAELLSGTRELRRLNEELHRLAVLDELTGISNRRFFNLLLQQEWGRAAREVQPLSLVMIDIDFFKLYNDHFGHPRGDDCLKRVAATLSALTRRPGDQVARYGGEEFVVLMPHTGQRGAAAVAELLRHKIEELNLEHPRSPLGKHVTISLGVATALPERRSSAELLVSAADQAVYEAKRLGRNRVQVFEGSPERVLPTLQGAHSVI